MDPSASSSSYPSPVGIPLSRSRKKLKPSPRNPKPPPPPPPPQTKWRTSAQERIFGRRLLEALRSARRNNNNANDTSSQPDDQAALPLPPPPPPAPRAIKEAADSALALTAKGQSRWSRAILSRRWHMRKLLLKAGGKIRRRKKGSAAELAARVAKRWKKGEEKRQIGVLKGKKVRDRLRLLARLVPGCRKVSTPSLLEETADYVAALELQVKAMRALADALSSAAAATSSSSSASDAAAAAATRPHPPPTPQS